MTQATMPQAPTPTTTTTTTRRQLLKAGLAGGLASPLSWAPAQAATATVLADGAAAAQDSALQASLHRAAARAVRQGLVGTAVGWVSPQGAQHAVAGVRQLGQTSVLQPDDAFYIGSTTKAMTSMVIARLVEAGALRWTQRITDVLPSLAGRLRSDYTEVTLAQLLDHRGGLLPFNGSGDEEARLIAELQALPAASLPHTLVGRRLWVCDWALRQAPPAGIRPGQDFAYSNAGYLVAAAMAEAATGQAFETLFNTWLAQPLALHAQWTRPSQRPADAPLGHIGLPSALSPVQPLPRQAELWQQTLAPAGFLACKPRHYGRWLSALQAALRGEATVLPRSAVARLQTLAAGDYALGWVGLGEGEHRVLAHSGAYHGFMSEVVVQAQGQWGAFALTNTFTQDDGSPSWVLNTLDNTLSRLLAQQLGASSAAATAAAATPRSLG